jgi:23S rRNA (guanosine2251-2'-O)-methyltransferase
MIICGFHAVEESLRSGVRGSLFISRNDYRVRSIQALAKQRAIEVRAVAPKELNRICGHDHHQGVALLSSAAPLKKNLEDTVASIENPFPLILLLDQLNDPHNLGAILRSADQLAVDLVVTTSRRSVSETPAVIRTSAGASRYVPLITVANLVQAIRICKRQEYWIYGADVEGESLASQRFDRPVVMVMGGEHLGLRRLVKESCDFLIRIPSRGQVDSFNVSVAAGILLYEVRRQQGFPDIP